MNVSTIKMPKEEALEKLGAYRAQLHRRADEEYAAIAAGYERLGEGKPLLSLGEVFRTCPFEEKGRPRLAIARADREQVHFYWGWGAGQGCFDTNTPGGRIWESLIFRVDFRTNVPPEKSGGYALVPLIPAEVREVSPASYDKDRFILWEVDEWSDRRLGAPPPTDPMLLEHLAGDLYVALAEWDLTELERAVLAGRGHRT